MYSGKLGLSAGAVGARPICPPRNLHRVTNGRSALAEVETIGGQTI
jgi:hypothetical protein